MAVVATIAVVVAIVAIILGPPLLWIRARVVDESGFTSAVRELGETTEAREYLADTITKQIAARRQGDRRLGPSACRALHQLRGLRRRRRRLGGPSPRMAVLAAATRRRPEVMQLDLTAMVRRVAGQVTPGLADKIPNDPGSGGAESTGPGSGPLSSAGRAGIAVGTACVVVAALASMVALAFSQHRGVIVAVPGVGCLLSAAATNAAATYLHKRATAELAVADPGMARLGGKAVGELLDNLHEGSACSSGWCHPDRGRPAHRHPVLSTPSSLSGCAALQPSLPA